MPLTAHWPPIGCRWAANGPPFIALDRDRTVTVMKHLSPTAPRAARALSAVTLAALSLLAAAPALAQTVSSASDAGSPYYLGAALSRTYANNVFQQNAGENSDRVTALTLLAGVDQRLGRQRVYANTKWYDSRYDENSRLDNRGYDVTGGLDWETVGNLSGNLTYTGRRNLADFNSFTDLTPTTERNLETNESAAATVRLGLPNTTAFALEGSYVWRAREYSLPLYSFQEYRLNTTSLGLTYAPSGAWRFGIAGRKQDGKTPANGVEFSSRNVDLTANWRATGASSFNARISHSDSDRYNGVTGAIAWDWRPGARWSLSTQLTRDTAVETYYAGVANATSEWDRVSTSVQTRVTYRLTGKVSMYAGGGYSKLTRDDDSRNVTDNSSSRFYNAGISWQALRNVSLGCTYNRNERSSRRALYSYDAYSVGCYVQGMIN